MERCPNCRARFSGEPLCYRCGSDLTQLLRIEAKARKLERAAVRCLGQGDLRAAEAALGKTLRLQNRPLALALRGFVRRLAERPRLRAPHTDW